MPTYIWWDSRIRFPINNYYLLLIILLFIVVSISLSLYLSAIKIVVCLYITQTIFLIIGSAHMKLEMARVEIMWLGIGFTPVPFICINILLTRRLNNWWFCFIYFRSSNHVIQWLDMFWATCRCKVEISCKMNNMYIYIFNGVHRAANDSFSMSKSESREVLVIYKTHCSFIFNFSHKTSHPKKVEEFVGTVLIFN